jgi:spermidine synthase
MLKKKHRISPTLRWPIFMAFFVSGVSGLMHQIVWSKLLVQLIGATGYAQAVVLAVFMGGLALGALQFGRRSDRRGKPLSTYVVLELLIGAYCLLLPILLQLAGIGYVSLANHFCSTSQCTCLSPFCFASG